MIEEELLSLLNRPLMIARKKIRKRLVLSPMAYLGNVAFRELLQSLGGCGLMFSEMLSAKRILNEKREISDYYKWRDAEAPELVGQILGNDPEIMAEAARKIESDGLFGVDINFGCSAKTICRQNQGAALLKNPALAGTIVSTVRKAISVPLFVKFRTGWKDDPELARELAGRFEGAGADALTFHPRVAPDRRARPPKWEYIRQVKAAVNIPVFGNGNVFSPVDCHRMIHTTQCDGVALGRIAIARPWVFAQWTDGISQSDAMDFDCAMRLLQLLKTHYEPKTAILRFKRFAFFFSANYVYGHTLYTKILNASTDEHIENILNGFFHPPPEKTSTPNLNFFM